MFCEEDFVHDCILCVEKWNVSRLAAGFFFLSVAKILRHCVFSPSLPAAALPTLDAKRGWIIQILLVKLLLVVRIRVYQVRERRDGKVFPETFALRIELERMKLDFLKPGFL